VIGIIYGSKDQLSGNYRRLDEDYEVIVGKEFWRKITGDPNFYRKLIKAIADLADEQNSSDLLESTVRALAERLH
jgi:hypothetical protein